MKIVATNKTKYKNNTKKNTNSTNRKSSQNNEIKNLNYDIEIKHDPNIIIPSIKEDFDITTFDGGEPIPLKKKWGTRYSNKLACLVLSIYTRNKVLMQVLLLFFENYQ